MSISSTFTHAFFVRILEPKPKRKWKKLPKRTFVRIFCAYDVDEIDTFFFVMSDVDENIKGRINGSIYAGVLRPFFAQ